MPNAYLQSADEGIIDVLFEKLFPLSILAGPAPHVFVVAMSLAFIEYRSADRPNDYAENKESNSEDCVVDGSFLRPPMTAPPVCIQDTYRHSE